MDEVLWRHSERSGLAITALPISPQDLARARYSGARRAVAEAALVA